MSEAIQYPQRIQIETFHGCNARCVMCPIKYSKREYGPMPQDIFSEIVRQAQVFKDKLKVVTIYMGGEPLLDKRISARVLECKKAGLPNVGFSTHALLLSGEKVEKLLDAGLDWLAISFDSLKKEVYESIRVGLEFETVLKNITKAIQIRNARRSSLTISMRFVELEANRQEFQNYLQYFSDLLNPEQDEIRKLSYSNWGHPKQGEEYYGSEPCPHVVERMPILSNGTVSVCSADYDPEYDLGNVMESSLLDIWNSEKWRKIRLLHAEGKRTEMRLCDVCNVPSLTGQTEFFGQNVK